MAIVKWSEWYEFGIPVIDAQHRTLFGILNRFHEAIQEGRESEQVGLTLDHLLDYTVRHFADEEAYLKAQGFPWLEEHHAEHEALMAQARSFAQRHANDPNLAWADELAAFLVEWVTHHITDADRRYADYLKERPAPPTP